MECNNCGKETATIMVICPECDAEKDEQIVALTKLIKRIAVELGQGTSKGRAIDLLSKKLVQEIREIV
jgi:hypothetical protein